MKTYELSSGYSIPAFGLGTWKSEANDVFSAVREAVRVGYRHFDCAWIYQNEAMIGRALGDCIFEGEVTRDELFITTKLWNCFHAKDQVERGCRQSLAAFGFDCADLLLMHWPMAFAEDVIFPSRDEDYVPLSDIPLAETWGAMCALVDSGTARSIGVSNFSRSKLEKLMSECSVVPAVNQIEVHPYHPQNELIEFCRSANIHVTAYAPLGSRDRPERMRQKDEPPLLENETVNAVAQREGIGPAAVLIAWAIARGTSVIPKSSNPDRIAANLTAASVELSAASIAELDAIETRFRYVDPKGMILPGVTHEGNDFWA